MATPIRTVRPAHNKSFVRSSASSSPAAPRRANGKPPVEPKNAPASAAPAANRAVGATRSNGEKSEPKILFQKYFHSVGPRTYAAQVKELANGNHLLVLTEGKRDKETGEARKIRLFIYGEDFTAFFRLLHETAGFIRANPLSDEIRKKRARFWAKKDGKTPRPGE